MARLCLAALDLLFDKVCSTIRHSRYNTPANLKPRNHAPMALRSTGRLLAAASSALSWTASQRVGQTAVRGCSRLSIGNKHRQLSIGVCLQTYQQLGSKTTNTSPRDQCHGALAVAHYPALHVVLNSSYTQPHTVVKTMTNWTGQWCNLTSVYGIHVLWFACCVMPHTCAPSLYAPHPARGFTRFSHQCARQFE